MTATTAARTRHAPLAVAQEPLWYQSRLAPNSISYNEVISIRRRGALDLDAFRRSFAEIVRRHEAWRTTFDVVGGEPVQVIGPPLTFDLPVIDLGDLDPPSAERQAVRVVAACARVPYDLRRGPLLRPRLIRFPDDEHRLYLAMHHIIFDGVSVYRVVLPEMIRLYEAFRAGRPSPLPEPVAQYSDYARWGREWIRRPRVARRFEHWRRHLRSLPELFLPLDRPRPVEPRFSGDMVPVQVPGETAERLRELARNTGATLFTVLATTWAMLLARASGQDEVVFATAADLRQRPEFTSVVGCCLTTLPLRVDLGGDPPVRELILRVRNELLEALDNLLPFERVVRELKPGPVGAHPVYQTMVVLEPKLIAPDPDWSIHQMESGIGAAVGTTKLDLELELDERPEGHIAGRLVYDHDLFDPPTVIGLVSHWLRLVAAVGADPDARVPAISLLEPAEEHRQLVDWNATRVERSGSDVAALVRARCSEAPDAVAVSDAGRTVTRAELDAQAAGLAGRLTAHGIGAGDVVAVCEPPGIQMVISALGVIQSGAAYLMLDPGLGPDTVAALAEQAGASIILGRPARDVTDPGRPLPGAETGRPLIADPARERPDPHELCCVHCAQPTAENPRFVAIAHSAVINLIAALRDELCIGSADTTLMLSPTVFEVPAVDLWLALIVGARVVVTTDPGAPDGARLSRLIRSEGISFIHASPHTWQTLIETGLSRTRGVKALCGRGPLPRELADSILQRCHTLWRAHGAPETTAYATLARVESASPIALGRPMANMRVYVVDRAGRLAPIGLAGELLVAGAGLARGYINRPAAEIAGFVEDPFVGGPAFRTGDLVRWTRDGELRLAREPGGDPLL